MNAPLNNITVRHQRFDFTQVPKYYFDQNPFLSNVLSALSLLFPHGERMFVESVRAVRQKIEDETLQKDISGFIGQEAVHSHVHDEFNEFVAIHNPNVDLVKFTNAQQWRINLIKKYCNPKQILSMTVGLEHITAIVGEYLLSNPAILAELDDTIKPLWFWHALEETEHKAVAFEVYHRLYSDKTTPKITMIMVTLLFLGNSLHVATRFTLADKTARGQLLKHVKAMGQIVKILSGVAPAYVEYFAPNFHPNNRDTTALLNRWREKLLLAS